MFIIIYYFVITSYIIKLFYVTSTLLLNVKTDLNDYYQIIFNRGPSEHKLIILYLHICLYVRCSETVIFQDSITTQGHLKCAGTYNIKACIYINI